MFYLELCFLTLYLIARSLQFVPVANLGFATKTSYNLSVELDEVEGFFDHQNFTKPLDCVEKFTPVHMTAIFRHGTRYPSLNDIEGARNLLHKLRKASMQDQLCMKLNDTLNKFPPDDEKNLAANGTAENIRLGFMFGSKFSTLFESLTENAVTFYVTSKKRTIDSFRGFLRGFQDGSKFIHNPEPSIRDDLLRFFDYCGKYVHDVDKNKSAFIEAKYFLDMKRAELNHLMESITNTTDLNVTVDEFESLLDVAGIEDAIFNTRYWVEIMSEEVVDILNYASDIEDYWKKGPGYAISYEQSCILVSEIFKMFDKIAIGDRSKKGVFYFSHAETLFPVFGLIGLFIDKDPLYHNNFHLHKNRAFKSTRISPFAGNIAFVLHECQSEMFIELLFKGRPLTWTICGNSICPYKQIRLHLSKYVDSCNFQERCKEDRSVYKNVEL